MAKDWERIERDYRLGQKSIRTLATENRVSPSTISRRVHKEGWVQDKTEEIRVRTRAALNVQNDPNATQHPTQQKRNTPSRADIEIAVMTNVTVIREHRKSILTGRQLVQLLAGQLNEAANKRNEIEEDICIDTEKGGEGGKKETDYRRRNTMLKAVSLPAHAAVLRDLSTALKNLIPLERQAFNLDEDKEKKTPAMMSDDELEQELKSLRNG